MAPVNTLKEYLIFPFLIKQLIIISMLLLTTYLRLLIIIIQNPSISWCTERLLSHTWPMGCLNWEGCSLTLKTDCQRTTITNKTRENYACSLWLLAEKVSFSKIDPQKINFCKVRFSAFLNLGKLFI